MLLAFSSSSFSSNSKSTSEMHFLALRNVDGASLDMCFVGLVGRGVAGSRVARFKVARSDF